MDLQNVYGVEVLSHAVSELFKRIVGGHEDLQDDLRSERPWTSRNAGTFENVTETAVRDRDNPNFIDCILSFLGWKLHSKEEVS
jgi:hypothetical protein